MTDIAIITDTHFGVRGDSTIYLDHQENFYNNIFFPELEKRNIKTVFHLGDLVDRRKYINFNTAKRMRTCFLDKLKSYDVHIITGNHDIFYKSTHEINALRELLGQYNFNIYEEPQEINFHDIKLLLLPWITQKTEELAYKLLTKSTAMYCFGHLEIAGFEMFKDAYCEHGLNRNIFDKFNMICSGHFHHKSKQNSIHYLGAPYQMTWSDHGFDRGFHILNLEKQKLTFIKNPYSLFQKLHYNDENVTLEDIKAYVADHKLTGCYIKIFVERKTDPYLFDLFLEMVDEQNPFDVKINESLTILESDDTIDTETQDTHTILMNTIETLDISSNKLKLKTLLSDLYKKAINIETE